MSHSKRQLLDQLYHTTFDIGRLMRQRMMERGDCDTNPVQLHALLLIEQEPTLTMSGLAKHLHMTSPSATSLVNRLVRQKLVTRRHDRLNRKIVRLGLTPAGRKTIAKMDQLHAEVVNSMFGHLSEEQLRHLIELHRAMLRQPTPTTSTPTL